MNLPSSRNALTLCMVIRLDALGDNRIIGSRFLVGAVDVTLTGVFRRRPKKYCFAASETLEKSVGLVPRRIVSRDVIVRSLEWIRRTAALRPLAVTVVFALIEEGSSVSAAVGLLSTTN